MKLERYLPLLDPDTFSDVSFFIELARIGYRQVLLGGTGATDLRSLAQAIKRETDLKLVLVPAGPASVTPGVDLVVLPDVMNSNSHFGRPFGINAVATGANITRHGLPYLPVAYFVMGDSTAGWYFDAAPIRQPKLLWQYANYARMIGYRFLALDYEDPKIPVDPKLVTSLRSIAGLEIIVSDEVDAPGALQLLDLGVHTIITPSDVYEEASDPLALAAEMYATLLRPVHG